MGEDDSLFRRDDIEALWTYLETLMVQLNVQLKDPATVTMAYDTRFVRKEVCLEFLIQLSILQSQ